MVPGYEVKDEATRAALVIKCLKPFYGLNQSPKNWHRTPSWEAAPQP